MAYNTYQDLVDSIAGYLKEDDLASQIGDFILLFEAVARAKFRHPLNEIRESLTVDAKYVTLPNDAWHVKSIELQVTTGNRWVDQTSNEWIAKTYGLEQTGQPDKFAVVTANTARFGPIPDGSYDAELIYWCKLTSLVDSNNWLYDNFPMIYVYGTLLQAEPWLENDQRLLTWQALYNGAVNALDADAQGKEFGGSVRSTARVRKV